MEKIKKIIGMKLATRLAHLLDEFVYDYDYYEYMDSCEDREDGFNKALDVITEDEVDCFRIEDYLKEIIDELDTKDPEEKSYKVRAKKILKGISFYRRCLYRYHIALV